MTGFCPHLWKTITIDHKGDVYHCCKIQPEILGSIYNQDLISLINTPEIVRVRQSALNGDLPCFADCNLIQKDILPSASVNSTCDYHQLTDLYLDFGMKCNISCIMCRQRERYTFDKRTLDYSVLTKNIDFSPFKNIYLQGGEPLYIDQCLKMMTYLGEIRKKYSLLTNGLLINDTMAEVLARDAKMISISINAATKHTHELINAGSSWERVLGNIQRLKTYRRMYGTDVSMNGRLTLTIPALAEIPLFIHSFQKLGFDTINFGYDNATVPQYLREHPRFALRLSEEIRAALNHVENSGIDLLRLKQLHLL